MVTRRIAVVWLLSLALCEHVFSIPLFIPDRGYIPLFIPDPGYPFSHPRSGIYPSFHPRSRISVGEIAATCKAREHNKNNNARR
jgi:hypothetical protein